jgi:oligopeptide transport system substrate-binding protein
MCGWKSKPAIPAPRLPTVAENRHRSRGATRRFAAHLFLLTLLATGCAKRNTPSGVRTTGNPPERAGVLRVSQRNEPADLDPATTSLPDEFGILRAVLEGLLIPGSQGGPPQPGAAESYTVSEDQLVYTFHLRPEARWSDGEPVTAGQFVDAYRRLLTPATAAPKAGVFFPVKNARAFVSGTVTDFARVGFKVADAHTLVITLDHPTARFPYFVASGPWLPVRTDLIAKHGRHWTRPENFVGNGPFLLSEWRADQRIVVRRNPHWHHAADVRLAEIDFVRFDSGDSEERAYRAGQIDATMSVPSTKVAVYERERPAELHRAPMIETRYLAFNTRRPPLDQPALRLALALAIDRQALVARVLKGGQPVAELLLPPALRGSDAADVMPMAHHFDPNRARALLAAAGIDARTLRPLEATAWSPSQTPVLEAVQAMWKQELGLNLTIAVREAKVHLSSLVAGDYDVGFITAIPDVADAAEVLGDFVTNAPENYPHWSDARFDQNLAAARILADSAPRAALLRTAEGRLLEASPLTPLYYNPKIWLMTPRVHGWQEDGLWARCYHTVYLDEK